MTLSGTRQQRDVTILQLPCALPTHRYDVNRQLLAMEEWWSRKGGVNQQLIPDPSGYLLLELEKQM